MTPAPDPSKPQQQIRRERPELTFGISPLHKVGITPPPQQGDERVNFLANHIYNEFPCSGLKTKNNERFSHDLELLLLLSRFSRVQFCATP